MMERTLKVIFKMAVVIFVLLLLYELLHMLATFERGYEAIGGEALVFYIPLICKALK